MKIKQKNKMGFDGKVKITLAKLKTPAQWKLNNKIKELQKKGLPFIDLVRKLNKICEVKVFHYENVTTTVGRTMIMNNLASTSPDNVMRVNYGALGDDGTTPVIGDTALGNETTRKLLGSEINNAAVGLFTQFYTAAEAIDTHLEAGLFSDGAAGAGTGILLIHALINITKTNSTTLTVDHSLQLNDV